MTPRRLPGLLRSTLRVDRQLAGTSGWGRPGSLRQPIFLIGAPRSGTTFLGDSLGAAPAVGYHHEPVATKAVTGALVEGTWPEIGGRLVFALTYRMLSAAGHGAGRRFCEKTPQNCFLVSRLARWYPGAQFVHIVRDGRDAALSYAEKPWLAASSRGSGRYEPGGYPWGPYARFWVEHARRAEFERTTDLHRCIWAWRLHTEAALDGLGALTARRSLEVRYEGLVAEPERHAALLGDFLELDPASRAAFSASLSGASTSSVGRWRAQLDEDGAAQVDREAGALLRRMGYA